MPDISTTLTNLASSIAGMQDKVDLETANGGQAVAKVAATKKAMIQAQALLAKTQGAGKTIDAKLTQIAAAQTAWTKAAQAVADAPKLNAKALKDQLASFPDSSNIAADDFDTKALPAVATLDTGIAGLASDQLTALNAAIAQQAAQQTALDQAAQALDGAIQALVAMSGSLADSQKKASDSYAAAIKLAQAGDVASLYLGVVRYADFTTGENAVAAAPAAYDAAAKAANDALTAWKTCLAAEADAEAAVISKQLDYDAAVAAMTAKQQTRDQDAQKAVQAALTAPPPKASSAAKS